MNGTSSVPVSESGPGSSLGRPEADSMQMAVDEINKAGGVNGHPLQITILDDESNATTAVKQIENGKFTVAK
jgi:branched-chain amino acid transport system substrate-binding protein